MEWISVKDQYPSKYKLVLAWGRSGNPELGSEDDETYYHIQICNFDCFDITEGPIWKDLSSNIFYCVTHWMNLPQKPK